MLGTRMGRCLWIGSLVAALGSVAWVSGVASAQGGAKAPAASVAVVNVGRVLELLDEKAQRVAELGEYGDRLQAGIRDIQARVEEAYADLQVLPKGNAQYVSKQDEAIRLEMKLQGEEEFAKFRFNERMQRTKMELFDKIVSAAGVYAQREGYDIVLNDDSDMTLPDERIGQMNDQTFMAFVRGRRVIFRTDGVDITDEVAQLMNNQHKAAQ